MIAKACFLDREALLDLAGENIAAFLQGQLTCDTRVISATRSVPGALCTPKGRVISDLQVLELGKTRFGLRLRASLAETTSATLARYGQFSRIQVSCNATKNLLLGVYGHAPEDLDGELLAPLPDLPGALRVHDDCYWLRRGPRHGEIGALNASGVERIEAAAQDLTQGREAHWQAEDLLLGHYAIEDRDSERFTPQALNYDLTDRIAFDKGCYTGQEVVARLHYKGQSKRRLAVLNAVSPVRDEPGSKLRNNTGTPMGTLLRIEEDQAGTTLVAAELLVDGETDDLLTASGVPLTGRP